MVKVKQYKTIYFLFCRSLAQNKLNSITDGTLNEMKNLREIYLEKNEFNCNCHIKSLVDFIKVNGTFKLFDVPACNEPESLRGKSLMTLDLNELTCKSELKLDYVLKFYGYDNFLTV